MKPDIAELEQFLEPQASQEAPATPTVRAEKLNLTVAYGSQRELGYTPLPVFSSLDHYPAELRFALKPTAKARGPLHFRIPADRLFL